MKQGWSWTRFLFLASIMIGAVLYMATLAGCTVKLVGNGEFGFKQSTSWGFYHETEKYDPADKSTANLDVSPAVDLLIKLEDAKDPGAGAD